MSEVLRIYRELRGSGQGHHAACRALARRLDVDIHTARSTVEKAETEEKRQAKSAA